MKITLNIIGLLLAGALTLTAQSWSPSHPSVQALQSMVPLPNYLTRQNADTVISNAQVVVALADVPAATATNIALMGMYALKQQTIWAANAYPRGHQDQIALLNTALVQASTNIMAPLAYREQLALSNRSLVLLTWNYNVNGNTSAANTAKNAIIVDSFGQGATEKIEAMGILGLKAQALNTAEGVLTNANTTANVAYNLQRAVVNATGFTPIIYRNTALWDNYRDSLGAATNRLRSMVVYCLTNFPVSQQFMGDSAKLQLQWMRVEAGNNTNRVTQIRRLIRQVANITPVTESTASFLGWLRGFHRVLTFAMPDESDPTALTVPRLKAPRTVDDIMEAEDILADVEPPYRNSVWGERWAAGMTPEEALTFAAMRKP